jgi:hypothetical protein
MGLFTKKKQKRYNELNNAPTAQKNIAGYACSALKQKRV